MTVLENSIRIAAPPEKVWAVLAALDALERYDPGIASSTVISPASDGLGAARKCTLKPGGWFDERVSEWQPHQSIAFELTACTLPVKRLAHRYVLTRDGDGTVVAQRMEYELKLGPVGKLLDALMVRRKWDAGIKAFFAGLKRHVEG